jgi:hypothetical protein
MASALPSLARLREREGPAKREGEGDRHLDRSLLQR